MLHWHDVVLFEKCRVARGNLMQFSDFQRVLLVLLQVFGDKVVLERTRLQSLVAVWKHTVHTSVDLRQLMRLALSFSFLAFFPSDIVIRVISRMGNAAKNIVIFPLFLFSSLYYERCVVDPCSPLYRDQDRDPHKKSQDTTSV